MKYVLQTARVQSRFERRKILFCDSEKAIKSLQTRSAQETVSLRQRAEEIVPQYGGEAVSLFGGHNKLFCNSEGTINFRNTEGTKTRNF